MLIGTIGYGVYALTQSKGGGNFPFPCLAENVTLHVHPWLRIWIETSPGSSYNVTYPNSTAYESLPIVPLDYCSTQLGSALPCSQTAGGNPAWGGGSYPYGTGHTIVIYYKVI